MSPRRLGRGWYYSAAAGMALAVTGFSIGRLAGTTRHRGHARSAPTMAASETETPGAALAAEPESPSEAVILAQRKRIMGRLRSLESIRRVATTIRPLVDRALLQPAVQDDLRILAARAGMSVDQYRAHFAGKLEADLLLESGGDPNAWSVSDACGVSQFLAGTGRRAGLKVDLRATSVLTRQMRALEETLAWLQEQPVEWSRPVPVALRGTRPAVASGRARRSDASLVPATAVPEGEWSRDQWIAYRTRQWRELEAKRRRVDERFDPAKAITVQSRYLVSLTRQYGGIDWALQAYHGGEGGVSRTIALFRSAGARTTLASRGGFGLLPYSELYRRVSPSATPAVFSYLFGRSDDHRYYWWKVLMAERALNLYRKDSEEFERQWQSLRPGYRMEAAWYPQAADLQFADDAALRQGFHSGALLPLPARAAALGIRTDHLAPLQKGLRSEAMRTLLRLAQIYRSQGGREPLTLAAMVQSTEDRRQWDAIHPAPPPKPGEPTDHPELHTTGLVFDLMRPARDWDRKVLEFALGRLYDSLRISWQEERTGGRRYHVVVNPRYREELSQLARR